MGLSKAIRTKHVENPVVSLDKLLRVQISLDLLLRRGFVYLHSRFHSRFLRERNGYSGHGAYHSGKFHGRVTEILAEKSTDCMCYTPSALLSKHDHTMTIFQQQSTLNAVTHRHIYHKVWEDLPFDGHMSVYDRQNQLACLQVRGPASSVVIDYSLLGKRRPRTFVHSRWQHTSILPPFLP